MRFMKNKVSKRSIVKQSITSVVDVIKLYFGGNLEILYFPLSQNSKNRIF